MPALAALLLDLDGTLVDTEPRHIRAHEIFLARQDMPFTAQDLLDNIGHSDQALFSLLAQRQGREVDVAAWVTGKTEVLLEVYRDEGLPSQPGAAEVIDQARAMGLTCMVVTSSERRVAVAALTAGGLIDRLPMRICREDTPRHKPHPEPYLLACKRLSGVRAAVAAGMTVIGYQSLVSAKDLANAGARRVVSDLRELLPLADLSL